ncbi:MAG: 3'(2'),5'-bisphosphate nucleotidase [Burkholderiales bacterium]|nr:MAG: 3'(2'),5'-bisphosphate nucleotidase [Burkholderiales bacterium]
MSGVTALLPAQGRDRLATLQRLLPILWRAGERVMSVYRQDFRVDEKDDASPVTEADRQAEALITAALLAGWPGVPVVAEEAVAAGRQVDVGRRFWLVDPLDGTREFVSRNGEFTVNVALVEDGQPVLGSVLAPASGVLYAGGPGLGAWRWEGDVSTAIRCRRPPAEGLTVLCSRSHNDDAAVNGWLGARPVRERLAVGSSLKFCVIAEGRADLYPRFGRTMEWDIAAGQAVLCGAGGRVRAVDGTALRYGKPGWESPHFVAEGLPALS